MKSLIKLLASITLMISAISCENNEITEKSLAGTWEYTIDISFNGTNNNTDQYISETKKFSGTFTWNEKLKGFLEGDIEYSYLIGYLNEGELGFTEDNFMWQENDKEYEAFCVWKTVPAKNSTTEFTTESGKFSWVEITDADGNEIFCSDVNATLNAKKIK